ncbi:MAG: hypothetical protein ABW215_03500 [Kibdelosporangium sp.]
MGRRRLPRRFGREWQRERAARAAAEAEATAELIYRMRNPFGRSGPFDYHHWRHVGAGDEVRSYRGFRAGRSRIRPDDAGYDEPAAGTESSDYWVLNMPSAPAVIGDVYPPPADDTRPAPD